MIGTSLGLGIGLQGQPKQYGEIAVKKLAVGEAEKKARKAEDNEFRKVYDKILNVKDGYVLPGQKEEYAALMKETLANMNKAWTDRDYSGMVEQYNNFKLNSQPYLQNFQTAQAIQNKRGELVIDEEVFDKIFTGDSKAFQEAVNTPYSGISFDPKTKTLSANLYGRNNLDKLVKASANRNTFEEVKTRLRGKGVVSQYKVREEAKIPIINSMLSNPSIVEDYRIRTRREYADNGQPIPTNEEMDLIVQGKIKSDTEQILNNLQYDASAGGISISNTNIIGGQESPTMTSVKTGIDEINFYGTSKVKTGGQFNFGLGKTQDVVAKSSSIFNQSGRPVTESGALDVEWGTSYVAPILKQNLTAQQLNNIMKAAAGTPLESTEEYKSFLEYSKGNTKGAIVSEELKPFIKKYAPEAIEIGIVTVGRTKTEGLESVYSTMPSVRMLTILQNNKADKAEMKKLEQEISDNKQFWIDNLINDGQKSATQPKATQPKATQPKANQPSQNKTGQGRRLKYNPQTKKME